VGHVGNTTGLPAADGLVKGACIVEHVRHADDVSGIPAADVLVEGACIVEQVSCRGHDRSATGRCLG
jgi:hypothetical protein